MAQNSIAGARNPAPKSGCGPGRKRCTKVAAGKVRRCTPLSSRPVRSAMIDLHPVLGMRNATCV